MVSWDGRGSILCNCPTLMNLGVPCRHILAAHILLGIRLCLPMIVHPRWSKSFPADWTKLIRLPPKYLNSNKENIPPLDPDLFQAAKMKTNKWHDIQVELVRSLGLDELIESSATLSRKNKRQSQAHHASKKISAVIDKYARTGNIDHENVGFLLNFADMMERNLENISSGPPLPDIYPNPLNYRKIGQQQSSARPKSWVEKAKKHRRG